MSLPALLAADLLAWMEAAPDGVPRRVLLWLDPERQFSRMVGPLERELSARDVRLLRYVPDEGHGQLALRLALLDAEGAGERVVVYLPGFDREALEPHPDGSPPALWSVYDQRFKGCVWGRGERWEAGALPDLPTLLGWLRGHGLKVADAQTDRKLATGGADSVLARYAERLRESTPADWPRPLRVSDVQAALAGDPRDVLRQLLAAPNNEVRRWGKDRALVLDRIAAEYGLEIAGEGRPEEIADAVAVQLALTEAFVSYDLPTDFPFVSRVPSSSEHRARQSTFLRDDVLRHTELRPRYRERMLRLEATYDLTSWATGRTGMPSGLPRLARNLWRGFLDRFDATTEQDWRRARDLALDERNHFLAGARVPWDGADGDTQWFVLEDLAQLARLVEQERDDLAGVSQAGDLITRHAEAGWRIDRLHLQIRSACLRAPGLERVRRVADLTYFDHVDRANQRFSDLLEHDRTWPPAGTRAVDELRTKLWETGRGRRAILICDACRWDMARGVKEAIDGDCDLEPVVSTLPSETPFGMTVLLPLDGEPESVDFGTNPPVIRASTGDKLETRDGRKSFLRTALAKRGIDDVAFLDLQAVLAGEPIPSSRLVVVFDTTIDEQGHAAPQQLPGLADRFIIDLKRTIDRLHESGVAEIHLVTDHGFLLLPPDAVDALGHSEVLVGQVYQRDARWAALKPDAPVEGLIHFPLPLGASNVELGFPRGVRTLVKASEFLHGGISLQECVIPHLVSRMGHLPEARLGIDVRVAADRLTSGTVPVILRPVTPSGQLPLGMQPATARVWIETEAAAGETALPVTEPIEVEVRPGPEEVRALYLKEGLDLRAGQRLVLRATDAETGQELGRVPLTLVVDWE